MPVKTPVYDVLTAVLEATSPDGVLEGEVDSDESTAVFSYRKREHFDVLWKMAASLPPWLDDADGEERTLVVSWDGMPSTGEGSINVADYVTPFDWALALSWSIVKSKIEEGENLSEKALPNLRILILDLKSQEHLSSLGVRTFTVASRALPWVHAYRPVGSKMGYQEAALSDDPLELVALRSALPVGSFGIDHMVEDMIDPERLLKLGGEEVKSSRADVEMLVDLWRSNLTRAGDRHHVGNLMAPLLLAEGLPSSIRDEALGKIEEGRPLRGALRKLAGVLGLAASKSGDGNSGDANREVRISREIGGGNGLLSVLAKEPDPFKRKENVRVGLVDDQYELGFHHVLDALLRGTQHRGELRYEADASRLFDVLRSQSRVDDWSLPRHLDLDRDVLLLDLRLWTREDERKAFFNEALSVCEDLGAEDLRERDPAFGRAFEAAKRLVSPDDQEANEIEALAFLPLLLSHYDPSLPIVLFSSTQQRTVLEMAEHRPNILTGFSKPILSGYGEEHAASDSLFDLVKEVRKAVHLHEARCVWERLPNFDWTNRPAFEANSVRYNGRDDSIIDPRLRGYELGSRLAEYYVHYLLEGAYYDFASVPYETVEGSLPPEGVFQDFEKASFNLDWNDPKNCLGSVLNAARNRKAHAHLNFPQSEDEIEEYRRTTIFLFLIFLDYMEAGQEAHDGPLRLMSSKRAWHSLRSNAGSLLSTPHVQPPHKLTSLSDIGYLRFAAYSALYRIQDCGGISGITTYTLDALRRILDQEFSNTALFIWLGSNEFSEDRISSLLNPTPERLNVLSTKDSSEYFSIALFDTHEDAREALSIARGGIELDGQHLSVSWNE